MSDIVEAVARAICVAEGLDPDKTSIGFGHIIPKGVEYKLWQAHVKKAGAAIAAVRNYYDLSDWNRTERSFIANEYTARAALKEDKP
jgi:hypothetical protein